MGENFSVLPRASLDFPYFTLTFRYSDTIKLVLANDSVVETIRQSVTQCWTKGIQSEGICDDGSFEIKFNGRPFSKCGGTDTAFQLKHFCCKMLGDLYKIGWKVMVSSDLSRTTDFSTLFFQRFATNNECPIIVCVSLSNSDSLQIVNALDQLKSVFKEAVVVGYGLGIQQEMTYSTDYELKLNGYPWRSTNLDENICARQVLLEIYRRFEQNHFRFYCTANLKQTTDCTFFIEDQQFPLQSKYLMVSLNQNDRLRLIDCPQNVIDIICESINLFWSRGLQDESQLINSVWEFKLKGWRWWADGEDTVQSRFLITMILQNLLSLGWCLISSLDVSRRLNDKSVLVFKSCQSTLLTHFSVSLNQTDKVRLINAPKDMPDLVRNVILDSWPYGIQEEGDYFTSYQFKLQGNPWSSILGNQYLSARYMMCLLLRVLTERGWRVICSADVSAKYIHRDNGPDYPIDVHSWFVAYTGNHDSNQQMVPTVELVAPSGQMVTQASELATLPSYSDLFH